MKLSLLFICLLFSIRSFTQNAEEKSILQLSDKIFKWEVSNQIDSLNNNFHEQFTVTGSDGNSQKKEQYISRLKGGSFIHNNIEVEESNATVSSNTAVVVGKGIFNVTVSGNKLSLHLSYLEVFTRAGQNEPWKVLAMKAGVLP